MGSIFTIIIIVGAIAASMIFAISVYTQYQPNFMFVQSGEPIQVGPVLYIVEHIGEHNGDDATKPEGIFYQIQIIAKNLNSEDIRLSGGQFYLLDENEKKFQPIFGNFTSEDLFVEILKPNEETLRQTQFDIQYDDSKQYRVGILPSKQQASTDIGIVCVQNC